MADALLSALENTPTLQILTIGDSALSGSCSFRYRISQFDYPSVSPTAAPILQRLFAPVEWAERLVPGRPIKVLKVYGSPVVGGKILSLDILWPLSATSVPLERLSLPIFGYSPILSVIGDYFPQLKDLFLIVPDVGIDEFPASPSTEPSELDHDDDDGDDVESVITAEPVTTVPVVSQEDNAWHPFVEPPFADLPSELAKVRCRVHRGLETAPKGVLPPDQVAPSYFSPPPSPRLRREGAEDVTASINTLPGMVHYAATHPGEWPLPSTLEDLTLVQTAPLRGKLQTPFYPHQERNVVLLLAKTYPNLRTVTWWVGAAHRWNRPVHTNDQWEVEIVPDWQLWGFHSESLAFKLQ
ncbi:hypothetical protein D9611_008559 [Ephemerocybe angulata]|uniref:Uncharacterized protein n=1 Tax=Ephemerocybe angulata TaxID=980116 RepID=A0A8H5EV02_9AGAR|nr:hypothetical protein D9611_008559 [Tulosesus angulatus]